MTLQEILDQYGAMTPVTHIDTGARLFGHLLAIDNLGSAHVQRTDKRVDLFRDDNGVWDVYTEPKTVTYLKPLHVILTEDPSYDWVWDGVREQYGFRFADGAELWEDLINYLGSPLSECVNVYPMYIPERWTHEVIER